ncbi:MAG: Bax inhibitor-1 family protein [Myxococcota bacterium]|nr:Bax inhibitor-1 family protein [Myxococcota bacterium]
MDTSLIFKTLVILTSQLCIVFGLAYWFIHRCRRAHRDGHRFLAMKFEAHKNPRGERDLVPSNVQHWALQAGFFGWMIIVVCMLNFANDSESIGLALMTLSSAFVGPLMGMLMMLTDENDGIRALKLTILTSIGLGVLGINVGIDASGLRAVLLVGLLLLVLWHLIDALLGFSSNARQLGATFGVILFAVYVFYHFNRLAQLSEAQVNDWKTALEMAIQLYLDVLNLMLEFLGSSNDS